MKEICDRCGEEDYGRRTIRMDCFYDMSELGIVPLKRVDNEYTLRVCKDCRADWMIAILNWYGDPESSKAQRRGCGSGIFIREFGANREITREQWDIRNPGREPVIYKPKHD